MALGALAQSPAHSECFRCSLRRSCKPSRAGLGHDRSWTWQTLWALRLSVGFRGAVACAASSRAARFCSRMASPAAFRFDTSKRPVFVVGNEAADVDSLVSAYVTAQLLESPEVQGIALAQIPREEFRLRGDALALFKEAGSPVREDGSPERLHFWDEMDWPAVDALASRSIVLTDHNKMTSQVASHFDGRVEWVMDHHAGGIQYPDARNDIDEGLGSCCSLVAEQFLQRSSEKSELGILLAGVILLDCRNFDEKEKKGTDRDRAVMDKLHGLVPAKGTKTWYKELMNARKDVSHLSVRDLMLLDTKVASLRGLNVAFASMFGTLLEICAKAGRSSGVVEAAQGLARDRGYQAMILLFSKDSASGKKALALIPVEECVEAQELCSAIVSKMLGSPGEIVAHGPFVAMLLSGNLPDNLRQNPLYETQGLLESGFQLELLEDAFGRLLFATIASISATSAVSGSHLNPAVSLAFGLSRKMYWGRVWTYIFLQIAAGVAACGTVRVIMQKELPAVEPKSYYNFLDAGLVEGIYSAMYCFVALNCIASLENNPRGFRNQFFALAIGLVLIAGRGLAGLLNPAITVGFCIFGGEGFTLLSELWRADTQIIADTCWRPCWHLEPAKIASGHHAGRSLLLAAAQASMILILCSSVLTSSLVSAVLLKFQTCTRIGAAGAVAAAVLFFLVRPEETCADQG
ncbi:Prune1 [Symbiodinium natans]|uniref:inorganic diphosphatase n=1 Tax=Symbiodinium natans TaxID=878477 RepID=A0A812QPN7_9DINO|nr:Prune1 [Symbiodinium natans]